MSRSLESGEGPVDMGVDAEDPNRCVRARCGVVVAGLGGAAPGAVLGLRRLMKRRVANPANQPVPCYGERHLLTEDLAPVRTGLGCQADSLPLPSTCRYSPTQDDAPPPPPA